LSPAFAVGRGAVVEGSLNLVDVFGSRPATIYVAVGAWATADGGALVPGSQSPPTVDGNGDLDVSEVAEINVATLGCACDDDDPCTADSCSTATNQCNNLPVDADSDGYPAAAVGGTACAGGTDCDDTNPATNPGAAPVPCSSVDNDCNGFADNDADGDTHVDIRCTGGDDCNDGDASVWSGAWYDSTTGYLWENPLSVWAANQVNAVDYCDRLSLCGYPAGGWRLPTVSELRSLIRDCPGTITGGECGLTDSCLESSCGLAACVGCPVLGGPGSGGCYWDAAIAGECNRYWSSSTSSSTALNVDFLYGSVHRNVSDWLWNVRCVRTGP
jgi:hypothetical protein